MNLYEHMPPENESDRQAELDAERQAASDLTPLTEEERGLVETVAKALGKLGVCPTKNSGSPWEALSRTQQIDLTTISETAVSATRSFYSERERALRITAKSVVDAWDEFGLKKHVSAQAALNILGEYVEYLRAPTDPAPSTTEGDDKTVWTCMSCGHGSEDQSCPACGAECMPGRWRRLPSIGICTAEDVEKARELAKDIPPRPTTEGVGGDEKPTSELPAHIAQAQEDVRARGMCGAVYDDPVKGELMCIRDPHSGSHGPATEGAREGERPNLDMAARVIRGLLYNDDERPQPEIEREVERFLSGRAPEQLPDTETRERWELIQRFAKALANPECDADCEGTGIYLEGSEWTLCECVNAKLDRLNAGEVSVAAPEQLLDEAREGVALIAAERERQVSAEGWTTEHDDTHKLGALATAAVGYITGDRNKFPSSWPFKPTTRVRDLTKAGALIAAELDRLLRAASPNPMDGEPG